MKLDTFITNGLREKAFLLYDEDTRQCVCIDPGNKDNTILDYIKENNLDLKYVLLTHEHYDHILGVKVLQDTGAKVVAHKMAKQMLENAKLNGGDMYKQPVFVVADIYATEEITFDDIDFEIKLLYTPGHTQGGCCYYVPSMDYVFTGDTLFRETIGRYDFYTGDYDTLINSIKTKLFTLPDNTTCFPGHGEDTSIIYEKKYNQHFN